MPKKRTTFFALRHKKPFSIRECARDTIGRYIQFYNNRRPHMSIGYKTPSKVHLEQGIQQKMWKKKIYTSKKKDS